MATERLDGMVWLDLSEGLADADGGFAISAANAMMELAFHDAYRLTW